MDIPLSSDSADAAITTSFESQSLLTQSSRLGSRCSTGQNESHSVWNTKLFQSSIRLSELKVFPGSLRNSVSKLKKACFRNFQSPHVSILVSSVCEMAACEHPPVGVQRDHGFWSSDGGNCSESERKSPSSGSVSPVGLTHFCDEDSQVQTASTDWAQLEKGKVNLLAVSSHEGITTHGTSDALVTCHLSYIDSRLIEF